MLEQPTRQDRVQRTPKVRREASSLVVCEELELETTGAPGFHDITEDVCAVVADSGVTFGHVTVFSCHTTAAIRINENEPLLLRDMARTLRQIAPSNAYYEHNDFGRRTVNMNADECANGHAHCQHLFLSTSEIDPGHRRPARCSAPTRASSSSSWTTRKLRQVLVTVVGN